MNTCIGRVLDSRTGSLTLATSLLIEGLIELAEDCEVEVCLISLEDSLTRPPRAQEFVCRHVEVETGVEALDTLLAAIEVFRRVCLVSDIAVRRRPSGSASMT